MVMAATFNSVAQSLTEPFVNMGLYASTEQALKHIILDYIERQIVGAETEIQQHEERHQLSFAEWTELLSGRATIADEDEWMEWVASRDVLSRWQRVREMVAQRDVS